MRTVRDRPTLLQRFPNGATGQVVLPEAHPARRRRSGCRRRRSRRPNGTTSRAIVMADIAHVRVGGEPGLPGVPPLAVPRIGAGADRRAAPRPRPLPRRHVRDGARGGHRGARVPRGARHRRLPQDHREPRPAPVRARGAGAGLDRGAPGGGVGGPGDGAPPPRPDHRRLVEGGARRAGVHRLQPERPPQDGVRRLVRARARRRPGVDARSPGTSWPPSSRTSCRSGPCPARLEELGDPWAAIDDAPQSIEPLLERYRADLAAGIPDNPWPPVYPKMPDEAPRVAPSRARKPPVADD